MDYKMIADDMWNEIYEKHYDDTENICDKIIAKAEKIADKPMKRKPKRTFVIAASVAAAAALTVSVGAATNWDIASLFAQRSKNESDIIDNWLKSDAYAFYEETAYPYMDQINVPENAGSYIPDYAHDREITERITQELTQTFEFEKFTVHMNGCMYDGLNAVFFFDIEYKNIFDALAVNPQRPPVSFYSPTRGGSTDGEVLERNGCTLSCTERMRISEIVDGVDLRDSFEVSVRSFDWDKGDFEKEYDEQAGEYKEKMYGFTLSMPDIDDLIYEKELSVPVELTGYGSGTLDRIRISPTMITFDISNYDNSLPAQTPVYVTMNDGTVLPLIWERDVSGILDDEENVTIMYCGVRCVGTVLDVNNIRSIQFYNKIIEL
ncbi:MAG: hypothetical protein IJ784_09765 [Ruminiclostridium sp.]|nr:hypothetical protein [Ruminiclostridium sp.]